MISIFVAKLDFGVDNAQLRALFEAYGSVNKATVALDKETGKSRGFAFVEMANESEGLAAISGLDGKPINGRSIAVKKAEDRSNQQGAPKKFEGGNKPYPSTNPSPRNESYSRPNQTPQTDTRPPSEPRSNSSSPFVPPILPVLPNDNRKKANPKEKERKPDTEVDRNKKPKMDAYKKSGKKDKFLDDDDDMDLEGGLFSFDDEEEDT